MYQIQCLFLYVYVCLLLSMLLETNNKVLLVSYIIKNRIG